MTQTNEELDRFLAEEVMGWMKSEPPMVGEYQYPTSDGVRVVYSWHPTTDIAQAMECAEKFITGKNNMYFMLTTDDEGDVKVEFENGDEVVGWSDNKSIPLAISLALYEAVKGGEHDTE